MEPRKLITVVVPIIEGHPMFEGSAEDVLKRLNAFLSAIPSEHRASATISLGTTNDRHQADPVLRIKYKRPETADESLARMSKDQESQRDVEVCERAQLKRLLAKYGSSSTESQTCDPIAPENV